ncbi:MAG TPA: SDR family NAD(P)-dependent oxidoreductase, partial [Prosthecobacter sp.]
MNRHSIEGKVAVVTGGAKNLGGLLSRALAERGAKAVVVHYNSSSSRKDAEETVAAVKSLGAQAIAVQADLSKPAANSQLFDAGIQAFGGVDIAINTAGMVIKKPILEVTEEDYDKSFDVNAK